MLLCWSPGAFEVNSHWLQIASLINDSDELQLSQPNDCEKFVHVLVESHLHTTRQ